VIFRPSSSSLGVLNSDCLDGNAGLMERYLR
jgi:hypothetical protein